MPKDEYVVVDLNNNELTIIGSLFYLWRCQLYPKGDEEIADVVMYLLGEEQRGNVQALAIKLKGQVVKGMEGKKNL